MADGYGVLTGELDAMAGRVDGVGDRLRAAGEAARAVTMNDSAYGVVCQPFAALLQPFEEMGVDALTAALDTVSEASAKIRQTARDYDANEIGEAARFDGTHAG